MNIQDIKVKGSMVKTMNQDVVDMGKDKYETWLNSLPPQSKEIFSSPILDSNWYSFKYAYLEPGAKMLSIFMDNKLEKMRQLGNLNASKLLRGIYKLYAKLGSPNTFIKRAAKIFSGFFTPGNLSVVEETKNSAVMHIAGIPDVYGIFTYGLAGWIERALLINGCKKAEAKISKSLVKGDEYIELILTWEV